MPYRNDTAVQVVNEVDEAKQHHHEARFVAGLQRHEPSWHHGVFRQTVGACALETTSRRRLRCRGRKLKAAAQVAARCRADGGTEQQATGLTTFKAAEEGSGECLLFVWLLLVLIAIGHLL